MTTCARCGHELVPGRFCTNCGAPVADDAAASEVHDWRTDTVVRPRGSSAAFVPPPAPVPVQPQAPAPPPASGPSHVRAPREVPRWLPWLLGWLLLAVVAAMIGWTFGSGSPSSPPSGNESDPAAVGDSDTDGAASPSPPASLPTAAADITAAATAAAPDTAPPNQDIDGNTVTYDAVHMLDGDPSTAWRMSGDGTGVVLTFTLPAATRLTSVGLVNGYAKVDGEVDWYPRNRRITSVTWGFDDGSTLRQDLIENPSLQTIGVDGVVTSSVTLTLTTVSEPGARDGRDFTPVSDIRLSGSAA